MSWFEKRIRNKSVKKKLFILVNTLSSTILILGIVTGISLNWMKINIKEVTKGWLPSAILAEELNTLTSDYRINQYAHLTSTDSQVMQEYDQKLKDLEAEIEKKTEEYKGCIKYQNEEQLLLEAQQLWDSYLKESSQVVELSRQGKGKEAGEKMLGTSRSLYNQFVEKYTELVEYNEEGSQAAGRRAENTFIFVLILTTVLVCFTLGLAYYMLNSIIRLIANPLKNVATMLDKMAGGKLETNITYDAKDEIGEVIDSVNRLNKGLHAIIKDEGYLLGQMAEGNFDIVSRETNRYVGDFEPVLLYMRNINRKLGSALSKIAQSASQVSIASDQMASDAEALADGATEQASAVEELSATAADVEQRSTIAAKQAQEASKQAEGVKKQAELGDEQMKKMEEEMNLLSHTSNEISTIIHSIEEIASQTNMLSLNAAIEAARAGEAGKGFAVVADEIGKLAKQSADAVNMTRELIGTTISQAENGNQIAKQTAASLKIVMEGILEVVETVDGVKEVCEGQAEAMKEIRNGVENISKVIESNSASAEESSATSEELATHADSLNQLLQGFRFKKSQQ